MIVVVVVAAGFDDEDNSGHESHWDRQIMNQRRGSGKHFVGNDGRSTYCWLKQVSYH
jgi:hypothetical protein